MSTPITRLKKRAGFERLTRTGHKCATATLVMQGALRENAPDDLRPVKIAARLGFTTSKKLGNAVTRNRIRRRLKAVAAQVFEERAHPEADYVVIGRAKAHKAEFEDIIKDMRFAVDSLHRFFNKTEKK